MNKAELKAEGKRLQTAIAEMFGVSVSPSQAYELLAKSKNFPCWDALIASASSLGQSHAGSSIVNRETTQSQGQGLLRSVTVPDVLKQISSMKSGLVIVSGYMNSGKSTLLANLAQQLSLRNQILTVGSNTEPPAQVAAHVAEITDWNAEIKKLLASDPDIIIVDEIRNGESAWEVVKQASQGRLVLAGLHCKAAHLVQKGLAEYLKQVGRNDPTFNRLVTNNQFLVIHLDRISEAERSMTMLPAVV